MKKISYKIVIAIIGVAVTLVTVFISLYKNKDYIPIDQPFRCDRCRITTTTEATVSIVSFESNAKVQMNDNQMNGSQLNGLKLQINPRDKLMISGAVVHVDGQFSVGKFPKDVLNGVIVDLIISLTVYLISIRKYLNRSAESADWEDCSS